MIPVAQIPRKYSYYRKLGAAQKRIYDKSDAVPALELPQADRFRSCMTDLRRALEKEDKNAAQSAAQRMISGLCEVFDVERTAIIVLAKRPSKSWGELHGLYEREEGETNKITVWMRTAERKQVVAFKTFLRTIIHEFIHHLDYVLLDLEDSFHTEGFFKRESSVVRQLMRIVEWGTSNAKNEILHP
jgi:tRNA/tmRNA/rRNA uracil-C5-methylase (TrmA/RlmC/RlmD family)